MGQFGRVKRNMLVFFCDQLRSDLLGCSGGGFAGFHVPGAEPMESLNSPPCSISWIKSHARLRGLPRRVAFCT